MDLITQEQVRHVARLSRLRLSDEEVATFTRHLGAILDYVRRLEELDLTDVQPLAHPTDLLNALRPDVPAEPMPVDQALHNAPDKAPPFFKVPQVFGQESA
jgi:aspartyl-tRNA(Asn)/glutamyl-tRNA(Gln) amidotransferase subunit C